MTADLAFDHLVAVVDELPAEIERWRAAGVEVQYGGVHKGGATENALVPLRRGGYLELLALTPEGRRNRSKAFGSGEQSAIGRRFRSHLAGRPGLADLCLGAQALDPVMSRLAARGQSVSGAESGGRQRVDGEEIEWNTAVPDASGLPFLIADVTDRTLRVPSASDNTPRLVKVRVAVSDLEAGTAGYEALCGPPVASGPGTATFEAGGVNVELCRSCEGGLPAGVVSARLAGLPRTDHGLPGWVEVDENPAGRDS